MPNERRRDILGVEENIDLFCAKEELIGVDFNRNDGRDLEEICDEEQSISEDLLNAIGENLLRYCDCGVEWNFCSVKHEL